MYTPTTEVNQNKSLSLVDKSLLVLICSREDLVPYLKPRLLRSCKLSTWETKSLGHDLSNLYSEVLQGEH